MQCYLATVDLMPTGTVGAFTLRACHGLGDQFAPLSQKDPQPRRQAALPLPHPTHDEAQSLA